MLFSLRKIILDEESSKEAQQIDHMNIDQPKEPIPFENVITPTPRKSSRVPHPPKRYDFLYEMKKLHVHEDSIHVDDSTTYEEALYEKDSLRWFEVMRIEMDSMYTN